MEDAGEGIDIHALIAMFRRRIWLVLGIAAVLFVCAFLVLQTLTPKFTASTVVMIETRREQVVDIESVLSDLSPKGGVVNTQAALIKSKSVVTRVIDKLGLEGDPEFNPMLRSEQGGVGGWLPNWLTNLSGSPKTLSPEERERVESETVFRSVLAGLETNPNSSTLSIEISFTSTDREKAARIANAVAEAYVLDQLEAKFEATRRANEWLTERLSELRTQLDEAERAVEIFRTENDLVSANTDGGTLNEQQLSELNSQLILARAERAAKQARYDRLQEIMKRGGNVDAIGEVLSSPVITGLRQQQAELARRQAELSSRYGPRHPEILKVQAEQRDLGREISQEIGRIADGMRNEVDVAATRERSLQESLEGLTKRASGDNQAFVQLRALERDATATRTLYESFLTRFRQTSEQQDLLTPDARVISEASIPTSPSEPKMNVLLAGALIAALGAGLGCAVLLELLDDTFHTTTQIEETLGVANLGVVPLVDRATAGRDQPQEFLQKKPLSSYAEAFRGLRTALALSNVDKPPKVVLFTSSLPGEGKTTAAASFALAASKAGSKVILLDCDLRRPKAVEALKLKKPEAGLVEYLAQQAALDDVLLHHESGLDVIPIVAGTANPTELLGSQHMKDLMAHLRRTYDLVVIDSAPVLPVSDTRQLAKLVDTTLFVVQWNKTPKAAAKNAIREFFTFGLPLAGVVLAQVDLSQQKKYGYGDGGYYYSSYSSYHSN
ncbi:polysaccharide biosynthesis tyrosine autokinase [Parvibaculum sp.]|uniref:GumC family protein n=1 Tax=Parvibaculum sp. TaxID=2024848 RepID=UPI001B0D5C1C|nr:polysaccharide biosynthesis tyrosine autokinase [Parvibaculum sp.]MBO6634164.1 polysaccharide biosynthesis tyrosine autokinase [Parvibaculum sp.]MBO6679266.1 polysaccharide biosynthesis tyrosine autokinase [Parvibaculum sp.]MBO6685418.1 polysaccharide biosynthesis tyrosine autokinase [Parvibaculum sp.]